MVCAACVLHHKKHSVPGGDGSGDGSGGGGGGISRGPQSVQSVPGPQSACRDPARPSSHVPSADQTHVSLQAEPGVTARGGGGGKTPTPPEIGGDAATYRIPQSAQSLP